MHGFDHIKIHFCSENYKNTNRFQKPIKTTDKSKAGKYIFLFQIFLSLDGANKSNGSKSFIHHCFKYFFIVLYKKCFLFLF